MTFSEALNSNMILVLLLSLSLSVVVGLLIFFATAHVRMKISSISFKLPVRDGWVERLERSAPKSLQMKWWIWLLAAAVFVAGLILLKSLMPALFAAVFCVLLPDQIAYRMRRSYRMSVLEHLSEAIRQFASRFMVSPQIESALAVTGKSAPEPVGNIFRNALKRLTYGDHPDKVFEQMSMELDSKYGQMFVTLLRQAKVKGQSIAPLFHDLASEITQDMEMDKANTGEISGHRLFGTILTILPLPLYFIIQAKMPELRIFMTGTLAGKALVLVCFLAGILWFYVERLVSESCTTSY